ncbi:hypothetical protein BuS5_01239 [Desulfosarcina sp. BuS5]|uniref:alginate lyase family protein n=1 Tax=Desulfosarcina sp. BuS5 TaxID=933262 RepID=UPI0023786779|nr:alginate lyase family protein [Desulfosarcina sp. BuS5]WDN88271.1 hypothetical protein BuS5_01239 [Desulfosarcina sp. BuS5]
MSNKYLSRLKNSSLPELSYRAAQFFLTLRLKSKFFKNKNYINIPGIDPEDVINLKMPELCEKVSIETVEEILSGFIFTLNTDKKELADFEAENRNVFFADIKTGPDAPDIRAVWEPARLQHITLLIAFATQSQNSSSTESILKFAKNEVLQWIKTNPFPAGPHYMSVMECGLRIPLFFFCLKILKLSNKEFMLILSAVYQHAWWISKRLSLYSSLGNHTVCECIGLLFAGAIYKKTKKGVKWLHTGIDILNKELKHQILEDGGPVEQSLSYHRFVLDLYWLAVDFIEKNDLGVTEEMKKRLIRAEQFYGAFMTDQGETPSIGDSDDGFAIAPFISSLREKTEQKRQEITHFKHSGYTIIQTDNHASLIFDHGSLGMAPLYNHGHADALSVTLFKDGNEIFVDPGTYRYNGVPEWRRYFKGTRAHNTVTVDGLDQAVQETGFIWSHPFHAKILKNCEQNDTFLIQAEHDGYDRLKKSVRHKRTIVFLNKTDFLIKDTFSGTGAHAFELNFHLHPDVTVSIQDGWWQVINNSGPVFLKLVDTVGFSLRNGEKKPLCGWYSPCYGIKLKCNLLSCEKKGIAESISFITVICTNKPLEDRIIFERIKQIEKQT